ncbi:MAG TPA: biopolymer transporter ExbD [Acidobacteriota bacterium]|nr:biopolymer transporter ExbD [Acidobacteriota bacterium]
MREQWFEEDDRILSEINVTPLVDVALVLLIVFMITAPMMIQGAEVRLPQTQIMDSLPHEQIFISVTDQGQILVNGDALPLEELEARLSPRVTPGRTVLLYGDRAGEYGRVVAVIEVLWSLGADIGLVTEPIPRR